MFVKVLEQKDAVLLDVEFLEDVVAAGDVEGDVVDILCGLEELLGVLGGLLLEETDDDNLGLFFQGLGLVSALESLGRRTGLFLQPSNNALKLNLHILHIIFNYVHFVGAYIGLPGSVEFDRFTTLEELEGWEALDLVLFSEVFFDGGVNLGQFDLGSGRFKLFGGLLIF